MPDQTNGQFLGAVPGASSLQRATAEARQQLLDRCLFEVTARGGHVVSRHEYSAVVTFGNPTNNVLHVLLTIFMCGLWLLVWIPMIIWGGTKRYVISVDEYGRAYQSHMK